VDAASALGEDPLLRTGSVYVRAGSWRWLEPPRVWLERGLRRALFENGAFPGAGPGSPALDAELVAFEAVLGSQPAVRVALHLHLEDREGGVLLERSVEIRQPLAAGEGPPAPAAVAEGLARALAAAIEEAVVLLRDSLATGS